MTTLNIVNQIKIVFNQPKKVLNVQEINADVSGKRQVMLAGTLLQTLSDSSHNADARDLANKLLDRLLVTFPSLAWDSKLLRRFLSALDIQNDSSYSVGPDTRLVSHLRKVKSNVFHLNECQTLLVFETWVIILNWNILDLKYSWLLIIKTYKRTPIDHFKGMMTPHTFDVCTSMWYVHNALLFESLEAATLRKKKHRKWDHIIKWPGQQRAQSSNLSEFTVEVMQRGWLVPKTNLTICDLEWWPFYIVTIDLSKSVENLSASVLSLDN